MPKLDIRIGHQAKQPIDICKPNVWIGSDESCDVYLREPGISRFHAQLFVDPQGRFWIQDAGGSFGTLLNGRDIEREQLFEGDEITLGRIKIIFHEEGAPYLSGLSVPPQIAGLQLPAPAPHPPHPPGSLPPALREPTSYPPHPSLGSLFPPEPHEQDDIAMLHAFAYDTDLLEPIEATTQSAFPQSMKTTTQSAFPDPIEANTPSAFSEPIETTTPSAFSNPIETTTPSASPQSIEATTQSAFPQPIEATTQSAFPEPPPTSPSSPLFPSTTAIEDLHNASETVAAVVTNGLDHTPETVVSVAPSTASPRHMPSHQADDSHAFLDGLMSVAPSFEDLDRDLDAVMSALPHPASTRREKSTALDVFEQAFHQHGQHTATQTNRDEIILPILEDETSDEIPLPPSPMTAAAEEAEDIWQEEQAALGLHPSPSSSATASYGMFDAPTKASTQPTEASTQPTEASTQPATRTPTHPLASASPHTSPLSLNETIAHILSHAPPSRHELSLSFQKSEVWANEADRLRGLLRQREEETSTLQERLRLQAQHHRDLMNTTLQRYREENEQLQRQIALYDQMRLEQAQMLQIVSELEEAKQQMREETQRLSAENQRLRAENQRFREGLLPQEAQRPTHAPISPDNTRRSGLPPQAAKKR